MWRTLPALLLVLAIRESLAVVDSRAGGPKTLEEYAVELDGLMRDKAIPFWLETVDNENGGYFLNHDLVEGRGSSADKYIITQARMVWAFSWAHSAGYSTDEADLLQAAKTGFDFLREKFFDKNNGGYFWSVSPSGEPLERMKLLQGQSFIILAYCEYYKASQDELARELALDLFQTILDKAPDTQNSYGGLFEDFTEDWTPISEPLFSGPVGTHGLKTANGVMHMMESLSCLYEVTQDPDVGMFLADIVDNMAPNFYPRNPAKSVAFRTYQGEVAGDLPVERYGHFVEYTWIRHEAWRVLGRKLNWGNFDWYIRHALSNGIEARTGSLEQEGALDWWPQTEFMKMVSVDTRSGGRYHDALLKILDTWVRSFVDPISGVSVGGISAEGEPTNSQLAGQWKSAFHEFRGVGAIIQSFGKE